MSSRNRIDFILSITSASKFNLEYEADDVHKIFTAMVPVVIGNELTVLAKDGDKVAGLLMSKKETLTEYTEEDLSFQPALERIVKQLRGDRSEELPDTFGYLQVVCVSLDYQQRGIGGKLVDWVVERAKEEGIKFLLAEASGLYSQKIFESRGFRTISEIQYNDFTDEEGKVVFEHTDPHDSIKLMVADI